MNEIIYEFEAFLSFTVDELNATTPALPVDSKSRAFTARYTAKIKELATKNIGYTPQRLKIELSRSITRYTGMLVFNR